MENIKIIKLENGDDIVCSFPEEQLPESHALLRIIKPLQIKYIPQLTPGGFKDYVAMVKWAAYTSDKVITIPKTKIMLCKFRILMPVLKVPKEATMIALSDFSVTSLIRSLSSVSTPP